MALAARNRIAIQNQLTDYDIFELRNVRAGLVATGDPELVEHRDELLEIFQGVCKTRGITEFTTRST
jgi:hypothetical protein